MTFHCYLQWIWGPINLTVSVFSWSTWVRVATKAFWKHLWETPSQTCISFCGTAVLAWCVAPTMCASARNMMLRTTDHVCKCKRHDVAYNRPCVQVRETWCCVAPTMCASARKMMLRSTDHVCKCKERYHPHPTPPPTSCVASTMSTPGEPPVPRVIRYAHAQHTYEEVQAFQVAGEGPRQIARSCKHVQFIPITDFDEQHRQGSLEHFRGEVPSRGLSAKNHFLDLRSDSAEGQRRPNDRAGSEDNRRKSLSLNHRLLGNHRPIVRTWLYYAIHDVQSLINPTVLILELVVWGQTLQEYKQQWCKKEFKTKRG